MSADSDAQNAADIKKLLAAISACEPDWPETDQVRFLRLFLEMGVDELEASEGDYYDFLTTCIQLAGENMQDARLSILESQIAELQNPPLRAEDLLTDAAMLLIGELLVVGGFYYAIPAFLLMMRNRGLATATRSFAAALAKAEGGLPELNQLAAEGSRLNQVITEAGRKLLRSSDSDGQLLKDLDLAIAARAANRDVAMHLRSALETNLKTAERALAQTKAAAPILAERWQGFVNNPLAHTVIGRAGEQLGGDLDRVIAAALAAGGASGPSSFATSTRVGDLLSAVQGERMQARREWADLRLFVRFLRDDAFLASPRIRELLHRIYSARPQLAEIQVLAPTVRSAFVDSFELILWIQWFAYNAMSGMMRVEFELTYLVEVGQIVDGKLVTSVSTDPDNNLSNRCTGEYYPAIVKLTPQLTQYLYVKYAREFFLRRPDLVPEPIRPAGGGSGAPAFDAGRYDEVAGMPRESLVIFENVERRTREYEMRLLVAIYFTLAPERSNEGIAEPVRQLMRQLLGLDPADDPLEEWLDARPIVPVPKPFLEPLPGQQLPLAMTGAIQTLLQVSGVEQKWLVGDALSQLDIAVTDLDAKIALYPLQFGPSATTSDSVPGARTAGDALRDIEIGQHALSEQYARFLELAAEQGDLATDVASTHQDRVTALTSWTPDADADLAWHWPATDTSSTTTIQGAQS